MGSPGLKPIETHYGGYRFRSRLEARWAVFFDALGILWEYEKEGFELDLGDPERDWYGNAPKGLTRFGVQRYLPDFWLPQVSMFAEVKPSWPTVNELGLIVALAESSEASVLILDGTPEYRAYFRVEGKEFTHGAWDIVGVVLDIGECHRYWETEGRFFSWWNDAISDWEDSWDPSTCPDMHDCAEKEQEPQFRQAVKAARSARFEHKERQKARSVLKKDQQYAPEPFSWEKHFG